MHARPSFAPPLHRRVVGLQIGQGWMSVLHEPPPGQSTLPVQPKPAFEPPEQRPVSHMPAPPLQSPSKKQGVSAGSEKPLRHRPVSLTHVPPLPQSAALEQPLPGVGPPPHRLGSRSPVKKMVPLSLSGERWITPVLQSATPPVSTGSVLTTHLLLEAPSCVPTGPGTGGPRRQPAFVHWSRLHVPPGQSAFVVQLL